MIDVRHLTRKFDGTVALDDVSFEVHPGEIVALLGPNGAGKTTASRIIGGILAPPVAAPSIVREARSGRRLRAEATPV